MITFADIFCGIGGFRKGIEDAAKELNLPVKCVFSSEIDKNAVKIYEKNFGETPSGDITKIEARDIDDIDILCGGFPCQAFSIAGKQRGFNDARGTFFFDLARIAAEKRPKILFFENVKNLLSHDKGRTFATILLTLDELGYDVEWQLLNSKDFGVPQNRERVFIIGHLRGAGTRQIFPIFGETGATTRENSSTCLDANYWKGIDNHGARTGIICYPVLDPDRLNKSCNGRRVKDADDPMFTLTAQDRHGVMLEYVGSVRSSKWLDNGKELSRNYPQGSRVYTTSGIAPTLSSQAGGLGGKTGLFQLQDTRIRKLTPTECERLQSYPDGWTEGVADTARYKCLGNSVTVSVIKAIARKILQSSI